MIGQQQLTKRSRDATEALERGSLLIAAAAAAIFIYGLVFAILDFTAFIEVGLSGKLVGATAGGLRGQNPTLYNYISHLQLNLAAFIMAYGIALTAIAWFGIRRGARWALWTALGSYVMALIVGLPIHYVYGLAAIGHVGPFYLVTIAVAVGSWLAYIGMKPIPTR